MEVKPLSNKIAGYYGIRSKDLTMESLILAQDER